MKKIEDNNTLVFIVDIKANKPKIKAAVKKMYEVEVAKVWTPPYNNIQIFTKYKRAHTGENRNYIYGVNFYFRLTLWSDQMVPRRHTSNSPLTTMLSMSLTRLALSKFCLLSIYRKSENWSNFEPISDYKSALNKMAFAAGAKIFKDAGETVSDVEQQLSQALVEVENNAAADLKAPLKELYFKVRIINRIRVKWRFTLKYWPVL